MGLRHSHVPPRRPGGWLGTVQSVEALGRFAATYTQAFGERPTDTLRVSRRSGSR
jgi:hypothetical protein